MSGSDGELLYKARRDVVTFARLSGISLRAYQRSAARAITRSVIEKQGRSFVVMFPRLSGKNELQAQIESYLLWYFAGKGGDIVKVSPTWRPQSKNAMSRLEKTLRRNIITAKFWKKESDYIVRLGEARCSFLSAAPESNIVGATASLLLEVDEAQEVLMRKFDRDVAPMAASGNTTRVFWGTAWTEDTLLARELKAALEVENPSSGDKRVFCVNADIVAAEVPAYKDFVEEQVRRFGRQHPLIRSQYFSEEISGTSGMFNDARLALMQGGHLPLMTPVSGERYVSLIDVAGSDETALHSDAPAEFDRRDAAVLTICRTITQKESGGRSALIWQTVARRLWINLPLSEQFRRISELFEVWQPDEVVIDATGVGAGLASMLLDRYGAETISPFIFTLSSKSALGWGFLAIIDSGRWQEYHIPTRGLFQPDLPGRSVEICGPAELQERFYSELRHCQMDVASGEGRSLRWGVPDGTRDIQSGHMVHDDMVISAALAAAVRKDDCALADLVIIEPPDALRELKRGTRDGRSRYTRRK